MNEQDAIQQELDRLVAEELPRAERDFRDWQRVRKTNRPADEREQSNGND